MLALLGTIGLLVFRKMVDGRVKLRIDDHGIFYRPWSHVTIPWDEIENAQIWPHGLRQTILLSLRSPELYPSTNRFAKMLKLDGEDVVISLIGMTATAAEALSAMKGYRR